jgi:DNA polymerase III, gamma and tau subunit
MGDYVELYKKYQPRKFKDIVGQTQVVRALEADITEGTIPSAYLFTGLHGSGKTSAAMLVAKALHCSRRAAGVADPCNECDDCVMVDEGIHPAVRYESMANRGDAASVQALIDEAKLVQSDKKNIIICDEVHRLSKTALDKFLIPLENRDNSLASIFIFCTTEGLAVSPTVKSRIIEYTFSPVPYKVLDALVRRVVAQENMDVSDAVIAAAVKSAHGSVRDALTGLERLRRTGVVENSTSDALLWAIAHTDLGAALTIVNTCEDDGEDYTDVLENMIESVHNVLLLVHKTPADLRGKLPFNGKRDDVVELFECFGTTPTERRTKLCDMSTIMMGRYTEMVTTPMMDKLLLTACVLDCVRLINTTTKQGE